MDEESFLSARSAGLWEELKGDIRLFVNLCIKHKLEKLGSSYGRLLTGGEVFPCISPGHFTGEKNCVPLTFQK